MGVGTGGVSSFLYTGVSGLGVSLPNGLSIPFPTLDLDFANTNSLDTRITFTRASNATYFDANGVLQTASSGVARFDHNPTTLQSLGLLIEEQRTNSIRNNTMQGAVAGTPGTLPTNWQQNSGTVAVNVVGTGTENGITYIDLQFVGTPNQTFANVRFETNTQIVAANGQTWTSSFYVRQIAGATTNITDIDNRIQFRDVGGISIQENLVSILSILSNTKINVSRSTTTATGANASIARITNSVYFTTTVGQAINITLRIGLPQLEQGAFATSVIPTTVAAATRNADVATMTGTNFSSWYNATEGTLYSEAVGVNNISSATRRYAEISDNTVSERLVLGYSSTSNTRWLTIDNGGTVADVQVSSGVPAGSLVKIAGAYKVNDFQQASNGTLGTADTSGVVPTVTQITIGSDYTNVANTTLNGHIRRIAYYPVRLSNDQLQALTR